jgi:endonuclease/exonuclease/phosphatase family metal-dependent hydrolase
MRTIPFYPLLVVLLVGMGGYLGCDPGSIAPPINPTGNSANAPLQQSSTGPQRADDTIVICSFNVKRLGPSKMANPIVMNSLAKIVQQFDITAIQEITDNSGRAIQELLRIVNQSGVRYALAISPRIGRDTGYYEQYAYIYDTSRIVGGQEYTYVVQDPTDVLHREPYVGRFQTRSANPFSFSLINIHTDPDEINSELDVLATVLTNVRTFEYQQMGHDDVILLGDLNAGPGRLRGLEQIPGTVALIHTPTMTRRNNIYDNFLIDTQLTNEFTGRAGTIDLQDAFGLTLAEALEISDHLPIWAEFSATRKANNSAFAASRPERTIR